jgi:hypothetical protein
MSKVRFGLCASLISPPCAVVSPAGFCLLESATFCNKASQLTLSLGLVSIIRIAPVYSVYSDPVFAYSGGEMAA